MSKTMGGVLAKSIAEGSTRAAENRTARKASIAAEIAALRVALVTIRDAHARNVSLHRGATTQGCKAANQAAMDRWAQAERAICVAILRLAGYGAVTL